jgi:hypothetical protein
VVTRLTPPNVVNDDYIDAIVAARQNGVNAGYFTGVKPLWKQWVRDYEARGGNPSQVAASTIEDADKVKFLTLYNAHDSDSRQGQELNKIRASRGQFCPACGEAGQPYTLDHYLPKDLYPEYSIIPVNLFPMCDRCQICKGVLTTDDKGDRYFIHPYYDDFAQARLLYITFAPPYTSPTMELCIEGTLTQPQRELTARHADKLELSARMQHYMKDEYTRLLRLVRTIRDTGGHVPSQLATFELNALDKSVNHWDHIWYSSVVGDPTLVDYLSNGVLPPFR